MVCGLRCDVTDVFITAAAKKLRAPPFIILFRFVCNVSCWMLSPESFFPVTFCNGIVTSRGRCLEARERGYYNTDEWIIKVCYNLIVFSFFFFVCRIDAAMQDRWKDCQRRQTKILRDYHHERQPMMTRCWAFFFFFFVEKLIFWRRKCSKSIIAPATVQHRPLARSRAKFEKNLRPLSVTVLSWAPFGSKEKVEKIKCLALCCVSELCLSGSFKT